MHRCRVQAGRGKPGVARPTQAQPEPAPAHRVGKDRSPADQVADVFVSGFDRGAGIVFLAICRGPAADQVFEPVPALHLHLPDVFEDLRGFQRQPFRNNQRHTPTDGVRLHPFQVPVTAHLLLLGRFSIDADRTVLDDHPEFFLAREVLETHDVVVLPDLLDVALHLIGARDVAADPERTANVVPHKHRECLGCPSGAPDGASVVDLQVIRPVIVPPETDLCNPLRRRGHHTLGQEGHRRADGVVQDILSGSLSKLPCHKIVAYPERGLFTGHLLFKLPDTGGDTTVAEERLHAVGKVACHRDLDLRSGVEAAGASGSGKAHRSLEPGVDLLEVVGDSGRNLHDQV